MAVHPRLLREKVTGVKSPPRAQASLPLSAEPEEEPVHVIAVAVGSQGSGWRLYVTPLVFTGCRLCSVTLAAQHHTETYLCSIGFVMCR